MYVCMYVCSLHALRRTSRFIGYRENFKFFLKIKLQSTANLLSEITYRRDSIQMEDIFTLHFLHEHIA